MFIVPHLLKIYFGLGWVSSVLTIITIKIDKKNFKLLKTTRKYTNEKDLKKNLAVKWT